jgi:hypothetical protein
MIRLMIYYEGNIFTHASGNPWLALSYMSLSVALGGSNEELLQPNHDIPSRRPALSGEIRTP